MPYRPPLGPSPDRYYGKTAVFTICRKAEKGPKICLPKKKRKKANWLIFIGGKGTFSLSKLCLVVARTWLGVKSEFFLAPKIRISAGKSIFSYGNLFFRTATWVAQVVTQILRPMDLVYDFSFASYARFREGTRPMPQKVFPHPTVRAPSASNSPSALSARALRARALRARAGQKSKCKKKELKELFCCAPDTTKIHKTYSATRQNLKQNMKSKIGENFE